MNEWYSDGLRFRCTQCGNCCSGEPGMVWVNDAEIAALAAFFSISPAELERQYVRRVGPRRALFERFDGDCVFLDGATRRCSVYAARPVQCRTWPFWDQNVANKRSWSETCDVCPGAGQGDLFSVEQIRERIRARTAARSDP